MLNVSLNTISSIQLMSRGYEFNATHFYIPLISEYYIQTHTATKSIKE